MNHHGEVWLPEEPKVPVLVSRLVRRAIWPFCTDNPSCVLPYWDSFVVGGRWTGIHTGRIAADDDKQTDEESTAAFEKDMISVAELRESFTAEILFCSDALYAAEATGGPDEAVQPMAGHTIRRLLRAEGIEAGVLITIDLARSPL